MYGGVRLCSHTLEGNVVCQELMWMHVIYNHIVKKINKLQSLSFNQARFYLDHIAPAPNEDNISEIITHCQQCKRTFGILCIYTKNYL